MGKADVNVNICRDFEKRIDWQDVTFLIKFPFNKCKHNKGQADVKLYMLFTKGSKEDAPIEKKDTKVAYQADKIENISKIQLIA